jgi:hypothetical protein
MTIFPGLPNITPQPSNHLLGVHNHMKCGLSLPDSHKETGQIHVALLKKLFQIRKLFHLCSLLETP